MRHLSVAHFAAPLAILALFLSCGKAQTPGSAESPIQPLAGSGAITGEFPVTLSDTLGRTLTLTEEPTRIISLSPGVTEILFALGVGDKLVGATEFCNYPPEALEIPRVGGFAGITVNLERVTLLEPDLVILSAEMHQRIISILDQLGIASFALDPVTFEDVYETFETLGFLTGHIDAARDAVQEMRDKIEQAGNRRGDRERLLVFWELADEPLISTGSGTFVNEVIYLAGGINVFGDLRERWPLVSTEQVLLRQPEWIIAGDDHGQVVEPGVLAGRPGWEGVPAVQNRRIATIKADALYRYGPRLADAVLDLADILWGTDR